MQEDNKYKTFYIDDNNKQDDNFNIREAIEKYTYHYKWFLLGVTVALIAAFLYLRYATYQYQVSTTILITDEENNRGLNSEVSAFEDLGLVADSQISLDTEMGILKSRTLMERVIKELGLQVSYYKKSRFGNKEVYKNGVPFNINLFVEDSILYKLDTIFSISARSATQFDLIDGDGDEVKKCIFGETIKCKFGNLVVTPKNIKDVDLDQEISVKIRPLDRVVIGYLKKINIAPESNESNLLQLSLQDPVKDKAEDILDNLVSRYINDEIEFKKKIASSTDSFIKNRIENISVELTNIDMGVETYKSRNRLSDMASEAGIVFQSNANLNNQIVELNSQIKLIDYMIDYMKTNKDDLIPANMGAISATASQNTLNYNRLVLERNRLLKGANKDNPILVNLNDQIVRLRQSIEQSLYNSRSSLDISLKEIRGQERRLSSQIYSAPKKEREITDIKRQQQIIESLYLYLLQKREESSISLAVTTPNAKVIDKAYGSNMPVSPQNIIVYFMALILGFVIPFVIIYIRMSLDNKVHTHEDIETVVKAPILGDIPTTKSKKKVIISEKDRSNVAEAFRLFRTNLNFMLPGNTKEAKTIFITSTLATEGKTFIAINLASALALLNKKVLLIAADIRKPKINAYLNIKQEKGKGLSHFLIDNSMKVKDLIVHHDQTNLDIVQTGNIPPNPSELLTNGRFDEVMAYGRANYDYVVVDTAPVSAVTDTLLVGHHADVFVYVVRANFLDKRLLRVPKMMHENKRLPNMAILINDTNYEKQGYGYGGYGYEEYQSKKSWFKRLFGA